MSISIENIAKVAHDLNKALCESHGDFSQPPWGASPDWQKESAYKGVLFNLENPDAPPSASHESWLKEKEINGWVYGEVKDPTAKTHPCIVPYAELPANQKAKDYAFKQIVKSLKYLL